jgi:hypothetical protein
MNEQLGHLTADRAKLAWRMVEGRGPTVVWLGGFGSAMDGNKAAALAAWASENGRALLRFDYFGHGLSEGDFETGTITRWRADALAMIEALTKGPLLLVGSSMGGWLACLVAFARPERIAGLVLVAPAVDFTEALLKPALGAAAKIDLARDGVWRPTSPDGDHGLPISRVLLEDGARWSILPGPIAIAAPVRILQGGADAEVPWRHALELASAIESPDLIFTLVRAGDHRLSRPQDLARLIALVEELR